MRNDIVVEFESLTYFLEINQGNEIYIKRDDLLPFSFGGNKARKAQLFFQVIDEGGYDSVVTYGSGSSNHCRVVANMAAVRNLPCYVVSTDVESNTANRKMAEMFGVKVCSCAEDCVAHTIDQVMEQLRTQGYIPFFIPGGGHGNTGTRAYDLAYDEICAYEETRGIQFDYIFFASGTGTTQAGLVCGKYRRNRRQQKIVGISIARSNPRGKQIIEDSVKDYLHCDSVEDLFFEDGYICGGYGKYDERVDRVIRRVLEQHGVPLDPTYTGKAYAGMECFLEEKGIRGKRILFVHTGGTPLFFDWVKEK